MRKLTIIAAAVALAAGCGSGASEEEPEAQTELQEFQDIEDPIAWFDCLNAIDPEINALENPGLLAEKHPNQVEVCFQQNQIDRNTEAAAKDEFREELREEWLSNAYGDWDLVCEDLDNTKSDDRPEGNIVHAMVNLEDRWRRANPNERAWSYDQQAVAQRVIKEECESWTAPPPAAGTPDAPLPWGEVRKIGNYDITVSKVVFNASEEQVNSWQEKLGYEIVPNPLPEGEHVLVTLEGVYKGGNQEEPWDDLNVAVVDKGEVRNPYGLFDVEKTLSAGEKFVTTLHFHIEPSTEYDSSADVIYLSPGPGDHDHDARVYWEGDND
jgi:hypothetical protein